MRSTVLSLLIVSSTLAAIPAMMPQPAQVIAGEGEFPLTKDFSVAFADPSPDPLLVRAAARLVDRISRQTGIPIGGGTSGHRLTVGPATPVRAVLELGDDESYTLTVESESVTLTAPTALGVLRGFATVAQLAVSAPSGFALPAVTVTDRPRFPWRGLHLDVSRHFFHVPVIKRNLDGMAAVKLNVFHWHLSDDQGFRVESKRYPKLHELGSDGLFYTQDQVRDVIAYARDRGIRVVPEFDIPGHATSWLAGYPEIAAGPGPFQIVRTWGIFDPLLDPTNENTYIFLDRLIGEMAALFPDAYFHIGGDEVNGRQWNSNRRITAFKRAHGMLGPGTPTKTQQTASNEKLQAYFNSRVEPLVSKHGKKMMGWDEVLAPELPRNVVIQSWRGQKSLADAVRQGFQGILSAGFYLDLAHPARDHYAVDPLVDPETHQTLNLTAEQRARILGGEACMWSEYVSEESLDSRIWPRTAAIAERLWSPAEVRDVESMYIRLEAISRNLDFLGLTHRSGYDEMLSRLGHVKALADVVEPVKDYAREDSGHTYTNQTPLNRLVDAARPESDSARHFAEDVAGEKWPAVRARLTEWKDFQLPPIPLVQEAAPLSRNLNRLGEIGLAALDYREAGQHPPAAWVAEKRTQLKAMKKPIAELLLMPVDSIRSLIQ